MGMATPEPDSGTSAVALTSAHPCYPRPMRLQALAAALNLPSADLPDPSVRGVTHNADWAGPGDVFVAIRGARFDGHSFIDRVREAGAVAVIGEGLPDGTASPLPYLRVPDARAALADAAAVLAGHPSRELRVVGVTGTDGKTTYERGAQGQIIPTGAQETTPAVDGDDVVLTIDRDLQWKAQQIVAGAVETWGASGGSAVVYNAHSGEVLALAEYPSFDPNTPGDFAPEDLGNRSISSVFEPGSTGKLFTLAAAIEEGEEQGPEAPQERGKRQRLVHRFLGPPNGVREGAPQQGAYEKTEERRHHACS